MSLSAKTSNASLSASILPYTHGLTGVNLWINDITTQATWYQILFVVIILIISRQWQLRNARLRMLSTLHLERHQQRYWSFNHGVFATKLKQYLWSAPLIRVRHNREFQLSRAIGIGTLPSRLHAVLLLTYLMCNIVYCCLLDYTVQPKAALFAEIRGRTGHLAVINMVALFVFAARNNPLIPLLNVSFDTFNLFHRWMGRIVVFEAMIHCTMWAVNKFDALGPHGVLEGFRDDPFVIYGLTASIAMFLILVQTPSPIRHAFYETFLHIHQFLAFTALIAIFLHSKTDSLPQRPIIFFIIGIWSSERATRLARIVYRNISHRGCTKVTIEGLEGGACRVGFRIPGTWTHRPGCHIYAYIPGISLWMSHPFSVAWVDHASSPTSCSSFRTPSINISRDNKSNVFNNPSVTFITNDQTTPQTDETVPTATSSTSSLTVIEPQPILNDELNPRPKHTHTTIYCIIAARTGMTASLYRRALASPTRTTTLPAFLEGPYGGVESLRSYGTVVLFAGGVGITHQLSQLRDLVSSFAEGMCSVRKVTLVWCVRSVDQLAWTQKWMEEVLAMRAEEQEVRVLVFVSGLKGVGRENERLGVDCVGFPGEICAGRVDVRRVLDREFEERIGAMSVGVCGPGAFADDVRVAARGFMGRGMVDFWEEAFTW